MAKYVALGVLSEDHNNFKRIALKTGKQLKDLFHEMVEREMKNEMV
jgi:hypothetical protein